MKWAWQCFLLFLFCVDISTSFKVHRRAPGEGPQSMGAGWQDANPNQPFVNNPKVTDDRTQLLEKVLRNTLELLSTELSYLPFKELISLLDDFEKIDSSSQRSSAVAKMPETTSDLPFPSNATEISLFILLFILLYVST